MSYSLLSCPLASTLEFRMSLDKLADNLQYLALIPLLGLVTLLDDSANNLGTFGVSLDDGLDKFVSVSMRSDLEVEDTSLESASGQLLANLLGFLDVSLCLGDGFILVPDLIGIEGSCEQVVGLDDGLISTLEATTDGFSESAGDITRRSNDNVQVGESTSGRSDTSLDTMIRGDFESASTGLLEACLGSKGLDNVDSRSPNLTILAELVDNSIILNGY